MTEINENNEQEEYVEVPLDDSDFKPKRRRLLTEPIVGRRGLIRELSKRTGFSMKSLNVVIDALIEIFYDAVSDGIPIVITSWLSLYHQRIESYEGVNAYLTRTNPDKKIIRQVFEPSQRSVIRLSKNLRDLSKGKFKERLDEEDDI